MKKLSGLLVVATIIAASLASCGGGDEDAEKARQDSIRRADSIAQAEKEAAEAAAAAAAKAKAEAEAAAAAAAAEETASNETEEPAEEKSRPGATNTDGGEKKERPGAVSTKEEGGDAKKDAKKSRPGATKK